MNWCQGLLRKMQCAPLHPSTYYVFKQNKIYYSFTCRKEIQILIGVGFFSLVIYFMITILQVQGNVSFLIHKQKRILFCGKTLSRLQRSTSCRKGENSLVHCATRQFSLHVRVLKQIKYITSTQQCRFDIILSLYNLLNSIQLT